MISAIFNGYAKASLGNDRQGDADARRGRDLQGMDRSFQGEDGSLAGRCCGRSCGQAASAKKAAGENDPSAALDLLQSLWIGAESYPGGGNGKACNGILCRIGDCVSAWIEHRHL